MAQEFSLSREAFLHLAAEAGLDADSSHMDDPLTPTWRRSLRDCGHCVILMCPGPNRTWHFSPPRREETGNRWLSPCQV